MGTPARVCQGMQRHRRDIARHGPNTCSLQEAASPGTAFKEQETGTGEPYSVATAPQGPTGTRAAVPSSTSWAAAVSQGTAGQDGTAHGDISEHRASCIHWITKPGTASPQAASLWDSPPCACPELLQPPHLPATDAGALRGQGPETQRPGTSPKPAEHPGERGKGALTSSSQHSRARLQGDITQRHEDPKIKETTSIKSGQARWLSPLLLLPSWLTFLRPGLCQLLGTNTNACTKNPQKAAKSHSTAEGSDPSKHSAVLQEG